MQHPFLLRQCKLLIGLIFYAEILFFGNFLAAQNVIIPIATPVSVPPTVMTPTATTMPALSTRVRRRPVSLSEPSKEPAAKPASSAVQLGTYCQVSTTGSGTEILDAERADIGSKLFEALKILKEKNPERFEKARDSIAAYAKKNPDDGAAPIGMAFCRLIEIDAHDTEAIKTSVKEINDWIDRQEKEIGTVQKEAEKAGQTETEQRDNYGNPIIRDFWGEISDDVYLGCWIVAREILSSKDRDDDTDEELRKQAQAIAAFSGGYVKSKSGPYGGHYHETNKNDRAQATAFVYNARPLVAFPPSDDIKGIRANNLGEMFMLLADLDHSRNDPVKAREIASKIAFFMPDSQAGTLQKFSAILTKLDIKDAAAFWNAKFIVKSPKMLFRNFYDHERKFREAKQIDKLVEILKGVPTKDLLQHFSNFSGNLSNWFGDANAKTASLNLFDYLWKLDDIAPADRDGLRIDLLRNVLQRTDAELFPYYREALLNTVGMTPDEKKLLLGRVDATKPSDTAPVEALSIPVENAVDNITETESASETENDGTLITVPDAAITVTASSLRRDPVSPMPQPPVAVMPAPAPVVSVSVLTSVPLGASVFPPSTYPTLLTPTTYHPAANPIYSPQHPRDNPLFQVRTWTDNDARSVALSLLRNKGATADALQSLRQEIETIIVEHESVDPAQRLWDRYTFAKVFDALLDLHDKQLEPALTTFDKLEKDSKAKPYFEKGSDSIGFALIPFDQKAAVDRAIPCIEKSLAAYTQSDSPERIALLVHLIKLYCKSDHPDEGVRRGIAELESNLRLLKSMDEHGNIRVADRYYSSSTVMNAIDRVLTALSDGGRGKDALRVYLRDCRGQTWFDNLANRRNNSRVKEIQKKFEALIEKASAEDIAENIDLLVPMLPE